MYKLLIGILLGYTAKEEIRNGMKVAVRGLVSTYASVREDINDAVAEGGAPQGNGARPMKNLGSDE